ncbi:MAG: MarR family winged helix-turn-helix transcriptional regulator [Leptospirales bacterium]
MEKIPQDHQVSTEHDRADPVRHQLLKLFWMLGPAFIRWAESHMEKDGSTPKRMYLMGLLYEYGPMMMSSLKDRLGVTATNVTALVDALEKEGLVYRKPHPTDRRATIIELSPMAEEFLTANCNPFKDRVAELFTIFSEKEQKEFLSFLLRMRKALIEKKILEERSRSFDPEKEHTGS